VRMGARENGQAGLSRSKIVGGRHQAVLESDCESASGKDGKENPLTTGVSFVQGTPRKARLKAKGEFK